MSDPEKRKQGKKIGGLGIFLIILLILVLIIGSIFVFLPKIVSSAVSGGVVSNMLPEEVRQQTTQLNNIVAENLYILEDIGLTDREATEIVSALSYKTVENCLEDLEKSSITNSSELIDIVSKHIDLSAADLVKMKKEYYSEFSEEDLKEAVLLLRGNPLFGKSGFRVVKTTLLDILKSAENDSNK